jgi:hypothetical protein
MCQNISNHKMKEENENIDHRLEGLKNERAFRVPDGYFDTFTERLSTRIEQESKPSWRISWFAYLKPALGIAAVLAIAFLLVYVPVNLSLPQYNNGSVASNEQIKDSSKTNTDAINELSATFESLVHLSQSQFLSTLEEVDSHNDPSQMDPAALEAYLADNSFDYDFIGSN